MSYLSGISAEGLDFSRDGDWITYVAIPGGTLWRSKLDGSQRVQLTGAPMLAALPHWSPDGKRIAFAGQVPGRNWKIYSVSFDGGSPELLTQNERAELDATWHADGNSVVFGEAADSAQPTYIYSIDLRTRRVSQLPGSNGLCCPRVSPDSRFIAALSARGNVLMLFDIKTQKWAELPNVRINGYHSWSTDSKYICFLDTFTSGEQLASYRVRIADRKLERVADFTVPKGLMWGSFGPWSGLAPDGSPLFVRDISSEEIYALDLDLP